MASWQSPLFVSHVPTTSDVPEQLFSGGCLDQDLWVDYLWVVDKRGEVLLAVKGVAS